MSLHDCFAGPELPVAIAVESRRPEPAFVRISDDVDLRPEPGLGVAAEVMAADVPHRLTLDVAVTRIAVLRDGCLAAAATFTERCHAARVYLTIWRAGYSYYVQGIGPRPAS